MSRTILNTATIKVKSEELQIPFANLALALVMEEFLVRLSETEYAPYLWMKNAGSFGLDSYKRKLAENPDFYYQKNPSLKENAGRMPGAAMDMELAEMMMQAICNSGPMRNVRWEYQISESKGVFTINLTALLENIRVPFQVKIEALDNDNEKMIPYTINLHLCICNNEQLKINAYPVEVAAADDIFEIIDKLELINDMGNYYRLYKILKTQALDGRKVQLQLLEKCEKKRMEIKKSRLSLVLGYKKYAYMKKKWKAFLKGENRKSPEWEEIIDMLDSFLSPIWEMMSSNMIFIGDWMPELSRFLE